MSSEPATWEAVLVGGPNDGEAFTMVGAVVSPWLVPGTGGMHEYHMVDGQDGRDRYGRLIFRYAGFVGGIEEGLPPTNVSSYVDGDKLIIPPLNEFEKKCRENRTPIHFEGGPGDGAEMEVTHLLGQPRWITVPGYNLKQHAYERTDPPRFSKSGLLIYVYRPKGRT